RARPTIRSARTAIARCPVWPGEADDPLGEDVHSAVPGLVHRYPDRVLFLATGFCSTYCRYCTRSRMVGEAGGDYTFSRPQWEDALNYIADHPEIRDVLISGGDPLTLSDDECDAVIRHQGSLPLGITPYYASLMAREDTAEPLRRTHIPIGDEYLKTPGEADDPLGEDGHTAVPGLVHRYPDRVLFLATGFCSTYCRYCTRSRMVGEAGGDYSFSRPQWEEALNYIATHPEIRDVLISGGDPLTLSDERLDYLLGRLRAIKHVEFVRLGTKVPVVLPMRVTRALIRVLKKHHPLWMSLHFTHPTELTPEVTEATARLADAGIPLGSQTVLLKGINDEVETLKGLFHGLLTRRVRPYYLYQCDPISGSAHFRTSVDKGLELMRGLRGHTTGYAVPTYVVDAPGGGGKIPLLPDYVVGREGDDLLLKNFEGKLYRYTDPEGSVGLDRNAGAG
ncbi:MAG TPA: KamA family radical SAM protein, partial [Methyloceanibacter sp.]|nr:KamA family radical SAM protein [Methyloceanibacter sp.]